MESQESESVSEEQLKIREELSNMSFEELQKLKEKIGRKLYNEKYLNVKSKKKEKQTFKRENKNRPREMSSKIPNFKMNSSISKTQPRDPRFDPLCGNFDSKRFRNRYKFLDEIRQNEYEQLKKQLDDSTDPHEINKIKKVLQKMENQDRERLRNEREKEIEDQQRQEQIETLKQGKKPHYQKKSEKKLKRLVNKYDELQKTGKLKKYIEKKRKHNLKKDLKKMSFN